MKNTSFFVSHNVKFYEDIFPFAHDKTKSIPLFLEQNIDNSYDYDGDVPTNNPNAGDNNVDDVIDVSKLNNDDQ